MALLFVSNSDDPAAWRRELGALLPDLEVRVWPEAGAAEDVRYALVWKPEPGLLAGFPNLELIQSLGMGVDHIFLDGALPAGVPVARLVDPNMVGQMSEYVLLAALRGHRLSDRYDAQQREHRWRQHPIPDTERTGVGVMGLGALGLDAAAKFRALGFRTRGWSRSAKRIEGVETFHGPDGLKPFLAGSDILVCLLPFTPETENVINAETLAALPQGAHVVNSARGGLVVEEDLLAALESGHLGGATLDVFRREPLPKGHPFWDHPKVHVTPHVAALTNPRTAAAEVAENIRRVRAGEPPLNLVDRQRGY